MKTLYSADNFILPTVESFLRVLSYLEAALVLVLGNQVANDFVIDLQHGKPHLELLFLGVLFNTTE